jgi:16S rRNA (cytosine1402-N4)-methyltransferase
MTMSSTYHKPVMLAGCIDALNIKPNGTYVDVTYGGGGHSAEILAKLNKDGKLYAFDQDDDALAQAIDDDRLVLIKSNFRFTAQYLSYFNALPVDGLLADLGISSYQIDEKDRGFAFMQDGPLDMRMDNGKGQSVADWLNHVSEKELVHVLSSYGEIKNAKMLASAILANQPMTTTQDLVAACEKVAPKNKQYAYYAKVFQALRMQVNDELSALADFLLQLENVVVKDGRVVIMSYHSLEDRLVKKWIQTGNIKGETKKDFYGNVLRPFKELNKKPIEATAEEVKENSRARSAKLRVAIKTSSKHEK